MHKPLAPVVIKSARIRNEFVIKVTGTVAARAPEAVNPNIPTGGIELQVESLEIVSTCAFTAAPPEHCAVRKIPSQYLKPPSSGREPSSCRPAARHRRSS